MMRKIICTSDGSHTIEIPEMNVSYHSRHGAIQESMHVFIEAGLGFFRSTQSADTIHILEMGFGTGLNAFLTLLESEKEKQKIHYTSLEQYPLTAEEASQLNYPGSLGFPSAFKKLHEAPWNEESFISGYFTLNKQKANLLDFSTSQKFHIIYYDAFAPLAQPELWTREVFEKLHSMMHPGGLLVTYCSKGEVQRAMQAAGFKVEKVPGPPGKREMVRSHS